MSDLKELPFDEDEAERIYEEGALVFEATFAAGGEDASPMSDGSNYAYRDGDRYSIVAFDEPSLVQASSLRDVLAAYELTAVTSIARAVTCEELPHAELAKLLEILDGNAPEHAIRVNGELYQYDEQEDEFVAM